MTKTERTDRKKPASAAASGDAETPESLDQVRDILFGGQMRTVESRLRSVEERLSQEQQAMRAEILKKLEGLDAFAKRETQALHERVAGEGDARVSALKAMMADSREAQKAMEKRHADLEKALDRLRAELTRSVEELQHAKTDRAALVALLTDMATRLGDSPGKGGKGGKG